MENISYYYYKYASRSVAPLQPSRTGIVNRVGAVVCRCACIVSCRIIVVIVMVVVTMIVVVVVMVVVIIVVVVVIVVVIVLPHRLCVVTSLGVMVDTPIVNGAPVGDVVIMWLDVLVYAKGPRVVVVVSQLDDAEVPTPGDCQFHAIATCSPAWGLKVAQPTIPPAQATTARLGNDDNDALGEPQTTTTTTWKTLRQR
ncbi:hypothetical protein EDB89DRAFT_1904032 [Lactarius sanguifluus]|nr:hypothetical protein EDB89DRAFT_1904032 [Lactarius sanguifluus]